MASGAKGCRFEPCRAHHRITLHLPATLAIVPITVLQFILKILVTVFVVRLLGSMLGLFGGRKRGDTKGAGRVNKPDYRNLTPYEIEEAEFEEIPGEKKK